jgi:hypothetical protein
MHKFWHWLALQQAFEAPAARASEIAHWTVTGRADAVDLEPTTPFRS